MLLVMLATVLAVLWFVGSTILITLSIKHKNWWYLVPGIVCLAVMVAVCPCENKPLPELVTEVDRPVKDQPNTFIGKDGGVYKVESIEYMGTNIYVRAYRNLFALGWVDLGPRYSFYSVRK